MANVSHDVRNTEIGKSAREQLNSYTVLMQALDIAHRWLQVSSAGPPTPDQTWQS
jgi:hypothetical protein